MTFWSTVLAILTAWAIISVASVALSRLWSPRLMARLGRTEVRGLGPMDGTGQDYPMPPGEYMPPPPGPPSP
jgi:hypothetical protein